MRVAPFLATIAAALLASACQTIRPGTPATYADCDKLIAAYGKLRPGLVNAEEWGERDWDRFRGIFDTNGDGKVDRAELNALSQPPPNLPDPAMYERGQERNYRRMDRANKGYIDRADIIREAAGGFRMQDRNHDGWLTRDECAVRRRPIELV